MALLILCGIAGLLGGVVVYRQAYPPRPTEPEAVLDLVDDQVAELRGLPFRQPVSFTLLTSDELREKVEDESEEEWTPEDARDLAIVLAAFDLLDDPDVDLYELMLDLESEQIAGLYDNDEDTLYVISDQATLGPAERVTLVHELTHALQDQRLRLDELSEAQDSDMDSEAAAAMDALIEGDASLLETQYYGHLAPHEFLSMVWSEMTGDGGALEQVPPVIIDAMVFPYVEGTAFVEYLYRRGGWPAVNKAYSDLPQSTEHILHPERYLAGDKPRTVTIDALTDTLGAGWRWVDEDIAGEFFLRRHMLSQVTPTLAAEAAEGWGGDRFAIFGNDDDDIVLLLRTVWDTPLDALEFARAYTWYYRGIFEESTPLLGEKRVCVEVEDYRCTWWQGDEVYVLRAPTRVLGELVIRAVRR